MAKYCNNCGKKLDVLLPFQCKRCGSYYCNEHRLPEKHDCSSLKTSGKSIDKWINEEGKFNEGINRTHETVYVNAEQPRKQTNQDKSYYNEVHKTIKPLELSWIKNSMTINKTNIILIIVIALVIVNLCSIVFLKNYASIFVVIGLFMVVVGFMQYNQSKRRWLDWDRQEARWVRQWTRGVRYEEGGYRFRMQMTLLVTLFGFCFIMVAGIFLLLTTEGTIVFFLNFILAIILVAMLLMYKRK